MSTAEMTHDLDPIPCGNCNGSGSVLTNGLGWFASETYDDCDECEGTGHARCEGCGEHVATVRDGRLKLCKGCVPSEAVTVSAANRPTVPAPYVSCHEEVWGAESEVAS